MLHLRFSVINFVLISSVALVVGFTNAEDIASQPAQNQSQSGPGESLDELISGLDSEEFAERQAASQKLAEQGSKALPALEQGATGESREASQRSMELIKKLFESPDVETKKQAEAALKRLAEGSNAGIASRAKSILEPPQPMKVPNGGLFPGVPVQGGAVKVQFQQQFNGGGGQRVTSRTVNGVRDIEAQQGDRKIKIHDDPNKGIEVEITEKKEGQEETKKYEAKNAEELKKNHPEAYKVFDELGKVGIPGVIQVQVQGLAPGAQVPPGNVPAMQPFAPPMIDPAEMRKRRLESTNRALESIQKTIDQLEQQKSRILEQKSQLEKEAKEEAAKEESKNQDEKPSDTSDKPANEKPAE